MFISSVLLLLFQLLFGKVLSAAPESTTTGSACLLGANTGGIGHSFGHPSNNSDATTTTTTTTVSNSAHINVQAALDRMVETLQDISTVYIESQTQSWLHSIGYESVVEWGQSLPKVVNASTRAPKFRRRLEPNDNPTAAAAAAKPNAQQGDLTSEEATFQWDEEKDIETYFQKLRTICDEDFVPGANDTGEQCWQFLKSLMDDPRCTARMDSRTVCSKRELTDDQDELVPPWTVRKEDFGGHDAINLVIVGAGPAGLTVASALSELLIRQQETKASMSSSSMMPRIHITMFENRAKAPGIKLPYTRHWGCSPDLGDLIAVDPRIVELLELLANPLLRERGPWNRVTSVPLNVLETLLLLSVRQRGVTLVYGEDVTEHLMELQQQVPNLLVVDATGHRLHTLIRERKCGSSNSAAEGDKCATSNTDELPSFYGYTGAPLFETPDLRNASAWQWYPSKYVPAMIEQGHVGSLKIAEGRAGQLLYPVHANTGQPLASYWMHIHNIPPPSNINDPPNITKHLFYHPSTTPLCRACRENHPEFRRQVDQSIANMTSWLGDTSDFSDLPNFDGAKDYMDYIVGIRGLQTNSSVDVLCGGVCTPNSFYDGTDNFRQGIQDVMLSRSRRGAHSEHEVGSNKNSDTDDGPWFTARILNVNLLQAQAEVLMDILSSQGHAMDPNGMPIVKLPLKAMSHIPLLQENGLMETLSTVAEHYAGDGQPTIAIFLLRPYHYKNVTLDTDVVESLLRHSNRSSNQDIELDPDRTSTTSLPRIVRIGDSLFSGDVNLNSGLANHLAMIKEWMCLLSGKATRDECLKLGFHKMEASEWDEWYEEDENGEWVFTEYM